MKHPNILVVEDNETNLYLVRFLLEQAGMTVTHVENGLECLAAVASQEPDLILMDLLMPVMDGFETAQRLQRDEKTRSIPIIASSAYAQRDHQQRAMESGFCHYIAKPFDPMTFVDTVRRYLPERPESAE
ncbi:response regulator [Synoicihabitans lomoniglobus]|uniref:Response regulator n=1 Tax=Synoicihabitans lomoniglobus TaxID=2909285 RepID=A0AAF0CQW9_9BACT|nr:response regulator [Opitutaceae bacterium LMO-M01]WED66379.1 response regulator [Opitutaceae bacterium LMO-M01]